MNWLRDDIIFSELEMPWKSLQNKSKLKILDEFSILVELFTISFYGESTEQIFNTNSILIFD